MGDEGVETFVCEDGVVMCIPEMPGVYNVHVCFLPKAKDVLKKLSDGLKDFPHTLLMTATPEDNKAANMLVKRLGFKMMGKTAKVYERGEEKLGLNLYSRIKP
jgi:hypothetical protein